MHYTSPAHPQEKKQEYQIDFLHRLVISKTVYQNDCITIYTCVHSLELELELELCTPGHWLADD